MIEQTGSEVIEMDEPLAKEPFLCGDGSTSDSVAHLVRFQIHPGLWSILEKVTRTAV